MVITRRTFLQLGTAGVGAWGIISLVKPSITPGARPGVAGVGMCDWNLGSSADPAAVPKAREANLQGIQVSVGTAPDNIPLRDEKIREQYLELGEEHNITFHSVAAGGILNRIPLASEPQAAVYVIDALEAARVLGAKNVLLAFFGNGDLRLLDASGDFRNKRPDGHASYELDTMAVTRVVEVLRQIAPRAEQLGIALGLENTLTAKQNLEIIERVGSDMVQVYYDVGNSWGYGYDVPSEIRHLGNDRICEVHLKDRNTKLLGSSDGMVDMQACARALKDIGFNKWLVLETSGRENRFHEDTRTNVSFVKDTFEMA